MDGWLIGVIAGIFGGLVGAALSPLNDRVRANSDRWLGGHGIEAHVEVDPERFEDVAGNYLAPPGFVFGSPPTTQPPEGMREWWRWARSQGGADASFTAVLITLTATRDTAVVVRFPRLQNYTTTSPRGWLVSPPGRGGGNVSVRELMIDLDAGAIGTSGYQQTDPLPARSMNFTMSRGDVEQLLVVAHARSGHHTWWLDLPMIANGRERLLRVSDGGDPFVTVGTQEDGLAPAWFENHTWRFDDLPTFG